MTPFRLLCSKVHLYVGLALSLVLILISLTGSALVFRHEIDRWLNPELLRVAPAGDRAPLADVMGRIQMAFPEAPPRLVRLPQAPDRPYEVWLTDDRRVYADPYNGALLGTRGDEEGLMGTLFALHAELLGGKTGATVVGGIGLLTLLLAATGLVLWWPAVRIRRRHLRARLTIAWRRGPWRLNYDLHRAGGLYTALFLVLVAATGSALVFYDGTSALLNAATGSSPLPPPPTVEADGDAPPALNPSVLDDALRVAYRELPGAEATFLSLPRVAGVPLAVRMRTPQEWHPNGRSVVYFAPASGDVLRTDDMREAPLGARLLHLAYPLHVGAVGGGVVRVLYVLLGLTPALLSVTGALIWFRRWRKKHRALREGHAQTRPVARDAGTVRPRPVTRDRPTAPVADV